MEQEWIEMLNQAIPKEMLIGYLKKNPQLKDYTIRLSLENQHPASWKACWVLQVTSAVNDPDLIPYLDSMIQSLEGKTDGHQRELLKLIQRLPWNEDQEGLLYEACMEIAGSLHKSPSVRLTAFRLLSSLVVKYPELWHEVQTILSEDYLENISPGIRNSFKNEISILRKKINQ